MGHSDKNRSIYSFLAKYLLYLPLKEEITGSCGMETIVELTAGVDHEVLSSTQASGRIRSEPLLSGEPLVSYLEGSEQPKYVLRNKKSGVEIEGEAESTTMEPDGGYQAMAMVTDMRALFVIGMEGGDRTAEVALSDVVQAKSADSGLRSTALVIETINGRTWSFPCREETAAVASAVDGLAQTWANAERLADEVEQQLKTAHEQVSAGEFDAAAETVADVETKLQTSIERLSQIGTGAEAYVRERAETLARGLLELQGPIRAHQAATVHAEAQDAWRAGEYETAAAAYEQAVDAYESALERDSGPDNNALRDRLRGALGERELLRAAPLANADTARRRARGVEEPEAAAAKWENVLGQYQQLLGLSWPGDGEFVPEGEVVREQAAAAAADAIDDYYEAGRRRLGSADQFSVDGREDRAMVLYERAREQFEQANRLAVEAHPERVDEIEVALETVEDRLDGNIPTERLPADELSATVIDGETETEAESESGKQSDRQEASSSVIGRIQSQKQGAAAGGHSSGVGSQAGENAAEAITNTEVRSKLRKLDDEAFTQLVADLWGAQGWSTTVFSATNQVVYDIVAMRNTPAKQRLLLWTEHRPGDEQLGPRAIERCATARDSSQGAESATLVTNALLRTAAKQRAEGLDVTVIDGQDLVELLRFEGFLDRLDREIADL